MTDWWPNHNCIELRFKWKKSMYWSTRVTALLTHALNVHLGLKPSAKQGIDGSAWSPCSNSQYMLPFPHYLSICSQVGSQVENYQKWHFFMNMKFDHFSQSKIWKSYIFLYGFSRRSWWTKFILHRFCSCWCKRHLKF